MRCEGRLNVGVRGMEKGLDTVLDISPDYQ